MAANEKIDNLRMQNKAEKKNPTPIELLMMLKDNAHTVLDVGGMVPGVGAGADLANAGLYAAEGDKLNTGLSLAAATPLAGLSVGAGKLFQQIYSKMQKVGLDQLNRTEKSYIKRNFDKFREHIDLKRDYEDAGRDMNFEMDYPDETMSIAEGRHYEDLDLEALYKTMKKSKHSGGFEKEGFTPRQQEALAISLLKENPSFWKDPGFAEYYPEIAKLGKALSDDVPF